MKLCGIQFIVNANNKCDGDDGDDGDRCDGLNSWQLMKRRLF